MKNLNLSSFAFILFFIQTHFCLAQSNKPNIIYNSLKKKYQLWETTMLPPLPLQVAIKIE